MNRKELLKVSYLAKFIGDDDVCFSFSDNIFTAQKLAAMNFAVKLKFKSKEIGAFVFTYHVSDLKDMALPT